MLRAVAAGRAEVTCSSVPDVYVDGLCCCDHSVGARLVGAGLVAPARPGAVGDRVPAVVTTAGAELLDAAVPAAVRRLAVAS